MEWGGTAEGLEEGKTQRQLWDGVSIPIATVTDFYRSVTSDNMLQLLRWKPDTGFTELKSRC